MKIKRVNQMSTQVNLILDDTRNEQMCFNATNDRIYLDLTWSIVKTYEKFIEFIDDNGMPDLISFDHDLGDFSDNREYSGMDAAKWLVDYCLDNNENLPDFRVHSSNPGGSDNISGLLNNFKKFQQ